MKSDYISYKKIPNLIEINQNDIVYLSSDIMCISFIAKKNGEEFDMDKLLDSFLNRITEQGTLIIPTFNFDFSNKGIFDYKNSPSTTGALGNCALKRSDFRRTKHPMHSFAVAGKMQNELCEMNNLNSFGNDSPFEFMKNNNVIQVMLGTDYQRSMTFVHYIENMANVPYRFYKEFTGEYIDFDGKKRIVTYQYPARYLEYNSVEKFNRIGKILESKKVAKKYIWNNFVEIKKVFLGDSYKFIYDDIVNNRCRNIYDFSIDRDKIWESGKCMN